MATISLSPRYHLQFEVTNLFLWAVLALMTVAVLTPVLFVVISSFQDGPPGSATTFELDAWRQAFSDPGMTSAVWNTIRITVARQGIAFPLAILLAWILARTDIPKANWLEFLFWMAFFLPALPVTLGWILLLDPARGLLNQIVEKLPFVDQGPFNIYSFWGLVWAHLAAGTVAIKVMLLTPIFRNMDATLEEASHVSGASPLTTLVRVVVPIMAPVLLVVLLLSTIHSLQAFEMELILGLPFRFFVYSTRIYFLLHQEPALYPPAMALGSIILGVMLPLIILQRRVLARRHYTTVTGHFKGQKVRLGKWRWPVFMIVISIAMIVTVVPIFFLILGTFMKLFGFFNLPQPWTTSHWTRVLGDPLFLNSFKNTLILAGGTALGGVAICTVIAYIVMRSRFAGRAALDMISWLPSTLPGIILALGLIGVVLGIPVFRPVYGTMFLLIIAIVLGRITLGVQMVKSNFAQLSLELEEAAKVSGSSSGGAFLRVVLPLLIPTLLLVGAMSFASAAREVSTVALLATAANRPLSLLQLDFMVGGSYESAAIVGVFVAVLSTGVALLARGFGLRGGITQ